jgi:hypothetical protein
VEEEGFGATISGLEAGFTITGLTGVDAILGGLCGVATGLATGLAGGLTAAGGVGAAFFTDRIALPGSLVGGVGLIGGAGCEPPPLRWVRIRFRMRSASPSLIELLWLLTAMDSFSAASSTSLFSRPRSRDSS